MHEFSQSSPGTSSEAPESVSISMSSGTPLVENEAAQRLAAITVPEDTQLSPDMYRHVAVRGAEDWRRLAGYVRARLPAASASNDAEDVTQDVFLKLMEESLKKEITFEGPENSRYLLYGIARFVVMGARGKSTKTGERERLYGDLPFAVEQSGAKDEVQIALEGSVYEDELQAFFARASHRLSRQHRKLLQRLVIDPDLSTDEASQFLGGVKVATARSTRANLFKALRAYEQELEAKGLLARSGPDFDISATPKQEIPKPGARPAILQAKTLRTIAAYRSAGENVVAPQIPVYVGPWIVAAQDMRTYLKKMDSPTASALMIYPHDSTVADFRLYARSLLGDKADQVIIATNQEAEATQGPFYDYIALTDRTPDALYDSLRNKAGFLLRLLSKEPETLVNNVYTVPSYHEAGGSRMQWASADSVRYAQEWRFWTGGLLTEAEANTIAKRGEGPTARRLCHGVGSFIALQAEAEYPWDGKNTDAKLSLA